LYVIFNKTVTITAQRVLLAIGAAINPLLFSEALDAAAILAVLVYDSFCNNYNRRRFELLCYCSIVYCLSVYGRINNKNYVKL